MSAGHYRFESYCLDVGDRRLLRNGAPVDVNGRYFDALVLLVREAGRLVPKERFMDEVWRGIPVTDEALTQCIRTLRRELGDDASAPRFIETVPKHGYRFVAPVDGTGSPSPSLPREERHTLMLGLAGTAGGGIAGVIGGLLYGFAAGAQPGTGAVSVVLVIVAITAIVALFGAAGVAFGVALAGLTRSPQRTIAGGALGGLIVGGIVKLLGLDAFNLLLGHAPKDIAGPFEGVVVGAVTGVAAAVAVRISLRIGVAVAVLLGGAAGALLSTLGGRLMGGSLASLADAFPDSRLRLDSIGAMFGEPGFGPLSQTVTAGLEAALFAAMVVVAMVLAARAAGKARNR
jgi:DNA-binding winged helix-turn-helix (wHTH) protein